MENFQDWKPVTWSNPNHSSLPKTNKIIPKNGNGEHQQHQKLINSEDPIALKKYSSQIRQNVIQLRLAQTPKMNQEAFAKRLQIPLPEIKNLENGTGIYNGSLINKINRVFRVNVGETNKK